ncbi:MAG: DUF5719 family protein [Pseudolysinimonas sp.]
MTEPTSTTPRTRRGLVIGARIVTGAIASGVALVVVAAVGLIPLPTFSAEPRAATIQPAAADQVRVCPGAAVRLGDETGGQADSAFAIGAPTVISAAVEGQLGAAPLPNSDAGSGGTSAAPQVLRVPPSEGALLAGAQSQDVDAPDFHGLTSAVCAEPSGSIWLVGGALAVGRTTLLMVANPTDVDSQVSLEIWGEHGAVTAPGMAGIQVAAGTQVTLSLAGFAPGLVSPVVHVTARGGRVVADLQQSIVRGLDAVGVETIGGSADPSMAVVVPGVRILDAVGTARASALADWQDVIAAVRIATPGGVDATVTVRVVPETAGVLGASFNISVPAGTVVELPLDSEAEAETVDGSGGDTSGNGSEELRFGDGRYTVFIDSDQPVVAGVRATTAEDSASNSDTVDSSSTVVPPSDFAWFSSTPALGDTTLITVPNAPEPVISIVNPGSDDVQAELTSRAGGSVPIQLLVPAGGTVSVVVPPGSSYLLTGGTGLGVAVTSAAPGQLAAFVVSSPRPVSGPIVIHAG